MIAKIEVTEYGKQIINVGGKLLEIEQAIPPGYLADRMKSIVHQAAAEIILLAGFSIDTPDVTG